jgi:DUF1680 family protein
MDLFYALSFLDRAEKFAILLRIPEWCAWPSLTVNNEKAVLHAVNGYAKVDREWGNSHTLHLQLPMQVRTVSRN